LDGDDVAPVLSDKIHAALASFQDACDRRMAGTNAANDPKEPLFHYTTESAFFSILDSEQFWFTSIYNMDDPEELNFGFNVARELFKEATERSKGLARGFCRELGEEGELEKIKELMAVYSVSFGLRDDGQQWMDYADQGRGVAFGLIRAEVRSGH
jgi:hypothetical protein